MEGESETEEEEGEQRKSLMRKKSPKKERFKIILNFMKEGNDNYIKISKDLISTSESRIMKGTKWI